MDTVQADASSATGREVLRCFGDANDVDGD